MSFFEVSGKTTDNLAEAFEGIFAFISSLKEKIDLVIGIIELSSDEKPVFKGE
jgi:hypothetical protein